MSNIQGSVLASTGAGYVQAQSGVYTSGSRIMVGPKASAKISFKDGCTINLKPGIVTIGSKSPCVTKAQGNNDQNGAGGFFDGNGVWIAGAIGAGLLGIGIYAATRNGSSNSNVFAPPVVSP
ncbi:MAG: hypothetical protein AB7F96_13295 [Beijerinckiaceae bacterium]